MYSITVSGERDACTFKSRYDKEREISQSGRTRNVRNVNGARGEKGEGDEGRGGGYAYMLLGKLEFSAARSRSFLVQLIIPLHSNFFSLSPCFLEWRTSQSKPREWGKDEPRAKVLIERVTRIFVGGGRARRKVARVTLNAY